MCIFFIFLYNHNNGYILKSRPSAIIFQRYACQRNYEFERQKEALPSQPATSHPLKGITVCKLRLNIALYNMNSFVEHKGSLRLVAIACIDL